jgi:sarcosine/dimethylglycine N-methyltransferase
MSEAHSQRVVHFYDTHPINEEQIMEKIAAAGDGSTVDEGFLMAHDQDHYGGTEAVDVLARLAAIGPASHVLDVCSGLGGPARYLADTTGCRVTGIDLTQSRVDGAERLTALAGLAERVDFRCADAGDNRLPDGAFDAVIGEEAWCHVPNKERLIGECARVLKVGGTTAFTDIVAGPELDGPKAERLSTDMAFTELATTDDYRNLLTAAGCTVFHIEDLTETWATILVERLAMFRELRVPTTERFGAAHFRHWDDTYAFFIGLFRSGGLGGLRMAAKRE